MPVYFPAFAGTKLYCLVTEAVGCEQLAYKVVAQQRRGRASNPRLLDRKSDALPLSHRASASFQKKSPASGSRLGSEPHLVGQLGPGVPRVNATFHFFLEGNLRRGISPGGYLVG